MIEWLKLQWRKLQNKRKAWKKSQTRSVFLGVFWALVAHEVIFNYGAGSANFLLSLAMRIL